MESLEALLTKSSADVTDWPVDEYSVDELLMEQSADQFASEFSSSRRVEQVVARIQSQDFDYKVVGKTRPSQGTLFDTVLPGSSEPQEKNLADVYSLIKDAFLEVYEGCSSDLVIADPERNSLFVHTCWKIGIEASQAQLNRYLMNARKAKKLGKLPDVQRYTVSRKKLEKYLFASEVGMRILQDQVHFQSSRWVTLDDVLCDPKLGKRFFQIASQITPGFKPVDYRWAALSIRKAYSRGGSTRKKLKIPDFRLLGMGRKFKGSLIPNSSGFFWMKSGELDFYIGQAQNLKEQVESLIESDFDRQLSEYRESTLFGPTPISYSVAELAGLSASKMEPIKRLLIDENNPRMNVSRRAIKVCA